nr:N-acetylneuraminate synthase family protein [Cylindrospermum stagnale]
MVGQQHPLPRWRFAPAFQRSHYNIPVVTEVMSISQIELVAAHADMLQIGSRNMQNFDLLKALGQAGKPILLKRGLAATIEEFVMAAEYILSHGNPDVVLCERGIRSFDDYTRNVLDLGDVAALKQITHLPVIVDPSHAVGKRELVAPVARAAVACGADGLIIECHPEPEKSVSDAAAYTSPTVQPLITNQTHLPQLSYSLYHKEFQSKTPYLSPALINT